MIDLLWALIRRPLTTRQAGQSLVEYALIIVLIAIAVIATVALLGGQIGTVFSRITPSLGG